MEKCKVLPSYCEIHYISLFRESHKNAVWKFAFLKLNRISHIWHILSVSTIKMFASAFVLCKLVTTSLYLLVSLITSWTTSKGWESYAGHIIFIGKKRTMLHLCVLRWLAITTFCYWWLHGLTPNPLIASSIPIWALPPISIFAACVDLFCSML